MRDILAYGLIALFLAVFPGQLAAQGACTPPDIRTDVRPEPHTGPTKVKVGGYVVDLRGIDDVEQTISVDLVMRMKWTDKRLAQLAGCKLPVSAVWFPSLLLRNSGRIFLRWPDVVSVDEGGEVTYLQRGAGTFSSYHALHQFPFDTQEITLRLFPMDWTETKVALELDPEFTGIAPVLNISDWQVKDVTSVVSSGKLMSTGKAHSILDVVLTTKRYSSYYIMKIMLPIALIVSMSWLVFWIDPKEFGTQLGLSATAVLTMIAFIFATTNMLPRLGYFTLLDRFIAGATVFVFAALLQSLITGFLASRGSRQPALRIDLISRIVFPVTFAILCVKYFGSIF